MHHNTSFGEIVTLATCSTVTPLSISLISDPKRLSPPETAIQPEAFEVSTNSSETFSNRMLVHHVTANFLRRISKARAHQC
jgi:hypothetical protein